MTGIAKQCSHWTVWTVAVWLMAGCAGSQVVRYTAPDFNAKAPLQVAVLPFDNQSVDLAGPELLRKLVIASLSSRGYNPIPVENIDKGLKSIGITDGGQLPAVTPQQVEKALGVEGLFYGNVERFTFQNIGFALRRVVRLHLKFVLASTGDRLWEDSGEGLAEFVTLDKKEAERMFVAGWAQRGLENIFHTPLMLEAQEAVRNLLASLPPPQRPAFGAPNRPPSLPSGVPPGIPPAPPPGVPGQAVNIGIHMKGGTP